MIRGNVLRIFNVSRQRCLYQSKRCYERRRRKGDGTKTDIFEERAGASMEEYFRKETARQLKKLKMEMEKKEKLKQAKQEAEKLIESVKKKDS